MTDLVPAERQQDILRRLRLAGFVKVSALAEALGVHEMTIRRDLDALEASGLLERVHGGARLANQAGFETSYQVRSVTRLHEKAAIAEAARALVRPHDTLALDASTTALALLARLKPFEGLVILCSLDGAAAAAEAELDFFLLGGTFHAPARSFVGDALRAQLARLHPDKVFFSAKGFTPEAGFTDAHLPEVEVKEALVRSAGFRVALLDHSKFGHQALGSIVPAQDVQVLITDREPEARYLRALERARVRLIFAGR